MNLLDEELVTWVPFARLRHFDFAIPGFGKEARSWGPSSYLFCPQVGGLEVQNPNTAAFVPATPIVSHSPGFENNALCDHVL
jgi:hypothetical protein